MRRTIAAGLVVAISVLLPQVAGGSAGDLAFAGCIGDSQPGCTQASRALDSTAALAVTPNGSNLYVAGAGGNAVSHFTIAANGDLAYAGCIGDNQPGCTQTNGAIDGAHALVVTPDGAHLYVAGMTGNAVTHFTIAANGDLTYAGCIGDNSAAGCTATSAAANGADAFALTGSNLYLGGHDGNAVSHFTLSGNGDLTYAGCIGNQPGCTALSGATGAIDGTAALASDGTHLFAAGSTSNAVAVFGMSANGDLTYAGCIGNQTGCTPLTGAAGATNGASGLALGGSNLYVAGASGNAVSHFTVASDGGLTYAGCIGNQTGCSPVSGAPDAVDGPEAVAITPDGGHLYVAGAVANAVSHFTIASNGDLTYAGCIGNQSGCTALNGAGGAMNGADALAVTPDSAHLYVGAGAANAVSHLALNGVPAPPPTTSSGPPPGPSATLASPRFFDQTNWTANEAKFTAIPTVNIRVDGIEVTQGIQDICTTCNGSTLPARPMRDSCGGPASQAGDPKYCYDPNTYDAGAGAAEADYRGVSLVNKTTFVRVFADLWSSDTGSTTLSGATATLDELDRSGRVVRTFTPAFSPATIGPLATACPCVTKAMRANPRGGFIFILSQGDLQGGMSLRATVTPSNAASNALDTPVQCNACDDNVFTLRNIPFSFMRAFDVVTYRLREGGYQMTNTPAPEVFGRAVAASPVPLGVYDYAGTPIDVSKMDLDAAALAVRDRAIKDGWFQADGSPDPVWSNVLASGVFSNATGRRSNGPGRWSIVQDLDRPLSTDLHELTHGMGLGHSDGLPHPDGTPGCGGGTTPDASPPDNEGLIYGVGFDAYDWDPADRTTSPSTYVNGFDHSGNPANVKYYDYMSYCAPYGNTGYGHGENRVWISARTWDYLVEGWKVGGSLNFLPPYGGLAPLPRDDAELRRRAAAAGPFLPSAPPAARSLAVAATVDQHGHASIFSVDPVASRPPPSVASSPYRLEARNASGAVIASAIPSARASHTDGVAGAEGRLLLYATLPLAASVGSVTLSDDGQVIARRVRSKSPPRAKLVGLATHGPLVPDKTYLVRFSAVDPDGEKVTTSLSYSGDGGRHWTVVADRVNGSSVRVPGRALSASRSGQLRLQVSDGFDRASAVVRGLVVGGSRPTVHIQRGKQIPRVRADGVLVLHGSAWDDAGRPVAGSRLHWYAGSRRIGSGDTIVARNLDPRTRVIRLVATDSHGRAGSGFIPVRVIVAAPRFLIAKAPLHLRSTAHSVAMKVASTGPAIFMIAGRRYRVDRRPRTITIPIRAGRSLLQLSYSLASPGGTVRGTYIAVRR